MDSRDFKPAESITSALDELKNKSTVSIDCEPGRYNSLELCYFTTITIGLLIIHQNVSFCEM